MQKCLLTWIQIHLVIKIVKLINIPEHSVKLLMQYVIKLKINSKLVQCDWIVQFRCLHKFCHIEQYTYCQAITIKMCRYCGFWIKHQLNRVNTETLTERVFPMLHPNPWAPNPPSTNTSPYTILKYYPPENNIAIPYQTVVRIITYV